MIVVTNQAGVGRGYYNWAAFEAVQTAIEEKLSEAGAWLDGAWACAYHPDADAEYRVEDHSHRKPNPGMLLEARAAMGLSMARSWMVGDKVDDVEAGIRAGVKRSILVATGYGRELRKQAEERFRGNEWSSICGI